MAAATRDVAWALQSLRAVYDPLPPDVKHAIAERVYNSFKTIAKEDRTGTYKQRQILRVKQALDNLLCPNKP